MRCSQNSLILAARRKIMKRNIIAGLTVVSWLIGIPSGSFAHSGGTNSNGCHNQTSNGTYHCHNTDSSSSSSSGDSSSTSQFFPEDFEFQIGHVANITSMAFMGFFHTIPNTTRSYSASILGFGIGWVGVANPQANLYISGHLSSLSESSMTLGIQYFPWQNIGMKSGIGYHVYVESYDSKNGELVENYSHIGLSAELGLVYRLSSMTISTTYDFDQTRLWAEVQLPI